MKLTLVIEEIEEGKNGFYIGQLKEVPGVLSQGNTIKEVKENIADALKLYFEDTQEDFRETSGNTVDEGALESA